MMRILIDKMKRLGRDEGGAVLMVTLALFLFMYLSGAGVFAIGKVVKDRIHLQNATDAAAYSAAVVQADTLSRIATINRAMAWTYVSMTSRQMDYIVCRWLEETCRHHRNDEEAAKEFVSKNCIEHQKYNESWWISEITLNGAKSFPRSELDEACGSGLAKSMEGNRESFYSQENATTSDQLGKQIDDDLKNIKEMNECISALAEAIPDRVTETVEKVLEVNIPDAERDRIVFRIVQNENPVDGREYPNSGDGYLADLHNNESDENRFLRFFNNSSGDLRSLFGAGIDSWFVRRNENSIGIRRSYDHPRDRSQALHSEWKWWAIRHDCLAIGHPKIKYANQSDCKHGCDVERCFCKNSEKWTVDHLIKAKSCADNKANWDDRFDSRLKGSPVYARPLVLKPSYFGEAGTITVGIAKYNENPWYRILRTPSDANGILRGIFAAFNPYKYMKWTWAFSSAKAGYRKTGGSSRDYMIYGDTDDRWNLSESDWDAVFVPVRRAVSMAAESGEWDYSEVPDMHDWITKGEWKPFASSGSSVPRYTVGGMPGLPGMDWNGDGDLDWSLDGEESRGLYNGLEWYKDAAVTKDVDSSGNLNWNRLAEMLYH